MNSDTRIERCQECWGVILPSEGCCTEDHAASALADRPADIMRDGPSRGAE